MGVSESARNEILKMHAEGCSLNEIAEAAGVSRSTVCNYIRDPRPRRGNDLAWDGTYSMDEQRCPRCKLLLPCGGHDYIGSLLKSSANYGNVPLDVINWIGGACNQSEAAVNDNRRGRK